MSERRCPLCGSADCRAFFTDPGGKRYWRCATCLLTYLDPRHHPTAEAELAHYRTHENRVDDPRYRAHLARLAVPLARHLAPGAFGLDYGSGPGPALAHMLREAGYRVALYDPFFARDPKALAATYDFITSTETVEHFHAPAVEFARFDRLLAPGGWLGIMTAFQTDDAAFAAWHYRLDPTHVVFYRLETFTFLGERIGWHVESPAKDVVLMKKPAVEPTRRDA